jgi:hypothetical protein
VNIARGGKRLLSYLRFTHLLPLSGNGEPQVVFNTGKGEPYTAVNASDNSILFSIVIWISDIPLGDNTVRKLSREICQRLRISD